MVLPVGSSQLDTTMPLPILLEVFKNPKSDADRTGIMDLLNPILSGARCSDDLQGVQPHIRDLVKKLSETEFSASRSESLPADS